MIHMLPAWSRYLLAWLLGAASVMAFAPFGYGILSIFSIAALFYLIARASQRQAFWLGWMFGFGLMSLGVFWFHVSISQFGGINLPLAIFLTLLFSALMAFYYAIPAGLSRRFKTKPWQLYLLVLPALFLLFEWLRGWLLTGFPWLTFGYSQIDLSTAAYAPLLGVYGVSWLVMFMAGSLVLLREKPLVLLVLLGIPSVGYLLQPLSWTEQTGKAFDASIIQGSVEQAIKWHPDQFQPTLSLYLGHTASVKSSDLVIWPETAVPAFSYRVEETLLEPMHELLADEGRDLLLGVPVHEKDGRYYNAMLNIGQSGRGRYDKRHLVPFGEFMPLEPILKPLVDLFAIPMSQFTAGEPGKPLLQLVGYPAGISICYEDAFGDEIREALPEAAFLVNASNDAWFGDSIAPHQHLEIARMRALESERYLLRATNTGVSAIISPKGELMGIAPQFEEAVLTERIIPLEGETPYVRYGDLPVIIFLLLTLVLVARSNKSVPYKGPDVN